MSGAMSGEIAAGDQPPTADAAGAHLRHPSGGPGEPALARPAPPYASAGQEKPRREGGASPRDDRPREMADMP